MGRFGAVLVCVLGLVGAFPLSTGAGIWEELTDARVQEALQYGRERTQLSAEELLKEWTVWSADRSGAVIVKTDFISLAFLAWRAGQNGSAPTARELDETTFLLRALKDTLHVEARVLRSVVDWVEEFQVVSGERALAPISIQLNVAPTPGGEELRFDLYFPRTGMAPSSRVEFRVKGGTGNQVLFPIDLARIR